MRSQLAVNFARHLAHLIRKNDFAVHRRNEHTSGRPLFKLESF
jgi:hypothetical protein